MTQINRQIRRLVRMACAGLLATCALWNTAVAPAQASSTGAYTTSAVISLPGAIPVALMPCGNDVYVANYATNNVSVINPVTNTVSTTIAVGANPFGLACDGATLYVANYGGNSVSVIDTSTKSVVGSPIAVQAGPTGVAVSGSRLFVSNQTSNSVSVVDTNTRMVIGSPISVAQNPYGVAASNGKVYVAHNSATTATVIDAANLATQSIALGHQSQYVSVANGIVYFTSHDSNELLRVDEATRVVQTAITLNGGTTGLWIDGSTAYVPSIALDSVYVVDLNSASMTETLAVGDAPDAVATYSQSLFISHHNPTNAVWILTTPQVVASGSAVPTAPVQAYAPGPDEACGANPPPSVNWPGLVDLAQQGWGLSWAEWPNDGRGGLVCVRTPFYTAAGTWGVR